MAMPFLAAAKLVASEILTAWIEPSSVCVCVCVQTARQGEDMGER